MIVINELSAGKKRFTMINYGHSSVVHNQCQVNTVLNSLANNKSLDWSKFKAPGDDKIDVAEKLKYAIR